MAFTTKSCFHYCHPGYFRGNDSIESSETREDVDPLSSLGSNANNSPQAFQSQDSPNQLNVVRGGNATDNT
eukprot:scaffold213103_cov79-Cyclotella_meneghiniana.AAC.1